MAALGIPAAGLVVYDFSKSRGLTEDAEQFKKRMAKPTRPVDVKTFVKKMDRNIEVVGTPAAFDRMVQSEFKGHPIKAAFARALDKPAAFSGDNAFAFVGPSGKGYIIGKGVLSEAVVRHEMGHVKDYQSRKANMLHRGLKRNLLQAAAPLSRRAYDRTVYRDEKAAWRLAGDSPDRKDYEDVALSSYDKGFHRNRATLTGGVLGVAMLPAIMAQLTKRASHQRGIASSKSHVEEHMHKLLFESFQDELEKIAYVNPFNVAIDALIGSMAAEDPRKGAVAGAVGGTAGGVIGQAIGDTAQRAFRGAAPRASKHLPMAGAMIGSGAGAVGLARTIGGKKGRSPRAPKRRTAAQTAWMNRPENLRKINALLESNAQKMHNKPLNQLNEQQWQASYDKSLQTMTRLYQRSRAGEKTAYVDPSGQEPPVMGANYLRSGVVPANNIVRRMAQRRGMRNPIHGSTAAVSQPAMPKTAEVTYRGITFPGYNKPIASNRKGKKKMVLVKKGDKVRIVHFGQKGYQDFTQHKDKKRRKNYLTRSAGIRNKSGQLTKDDPFSPNYWARRKLW